MGLSQKPLRSLSDKELSDYLTFYLDSYAFHSGMARNCPENSPIQKLHQYKSEFYALRARAIEAIIRERKQATWQKLARVGIGLSVALN